MCEDSMLSPEEEKSIVCIIQHISHEVSLGCNHNDTLPNNVPCPLRMEDQEREGVNNAQ